ncbi:MAG: response regulator transcription factor [Candidatus Eisenbacteria bacterium]
MSLRVLIADDHPIFAQGLRSLLEKEEFEVVGEAADGRQAVKLTEHHRPDVAVLDLAMPLLNGLNAAREIAKLSPDTKTIILTNYTEEQYVLDALYAGVNGYVLKTRSSADLVQAIHEVSRGALYLSEGVSREALRAFRANEAAMTERLSGRERQVLQLIAEGQSMKEIAGELGISVKTVETHRRRLVAKLDIHETASLVRYAIRKGYIQP